MVNRFLGWLNVEGYITSNPMATMTAPKIPRRLPRALKGTDVGRLLEVCPDTRARLIVLLMAQCGLRRIEVVRLQWGDVDRIDRTLSVRGKGDHERLLPVPEEAWLELVAYSSEVGATTGPLLRSYTRPNRGLSTTTLSHNIAAWMRHQIPVEVTWS